MFCQVALLSPPYSTLTYTFPSYFPNELWEIGMRVAIPLGNSAYRVGIITKISEISPVFAKETVLRSIIWPMERKALLGSEYLAMVNQLALRQLFTAGRILGNVLPVGLRTTKNIKIRQFFENGKPKFYKLRDLKNLDPKSIEHLASQFILNQADVITLTENTADSERIMLATDPPWSLRANAHKQKELLDFLAHHGDMSRAKLKQKLPDCEPTINSLIEKKLLLIQSCQEDEQENLEIFLPPPMPLFHLNEKQQEIYDELNLYLQDQNKENIKTALLYGITGSGKTALYLELAKSCLENNKSVLLLAPEVAIALKLCQDAKERNLKSTLYHGYQNPRLREKTFLNCTQTKEAKLIIGTRSALFLPLDNIGLIILDEEHDDSFKQDEGLYYHAKEIAWFRMKKNKGLFLLGSATPDIKSFYSSYINGEDQKSYLRFEMKKRIGKANLPQIELIDFKECKQSLAPESIIALKECINEGNQAIIMLNRRGYAPLLYCLDCKTVMRCPHCDIAMSYHKKREQILCHYCGYTKYFPTTCSHCKSSHFLPLGDGTEKLEEDIYNLLTHEEKLHSKILRMDKDSTRRVGQMEDILASFAKQEAQILVGTQMLSKGHHFPNVTLVLIADADLGLNFPDYRAVEKTFQLLTQASGRAGRGEKKGKVLIQTRDVNHYCWDLIKQGDYENFYQHELELRKKYKYPPFTKLALIRASMPKEGKEALEIWKKFISDLKKQAEKFSVQIKGPSPAPLAFLQGRHRFHCLIKGDNWNNIRQIYAQNLVPEQILKKIDLRVQLDMDPVNML